MEKRLRVITDRAARAGGLIGALAVGLLALHVSLDVAARKLFGTPLPGTLTIVTYYYMLILAFAPLAAVEAVRGHIAIGFLGEGRTRPSRRHARSLMDLAAGLMMALLAWRGWIAAVRDWDIGAVQAQSSLMVPVWPARFVVPLGAGLMALVLVGRFVARLRASAAPSDGR